jgi:hypothetical protein
MHGTGLTPLQKLAIARLVNRLLWLIMLIIVGGWELGYLVSRAAWIESVCFVLVFLFIAIRIGRSIATEVGILGVDTTIDLGETDENAAL